MKKSRVDCSQKGGAMKKTKISYDKKKDILCIMLKKGVEERFEDISEDITVEYDAENKPIGIEIFNASKILPAYSPSHFISI